MPKSTSNGLYRRVFLLAIPIALQNVITLSVGLADNLMVGSLGEMALSGVYVANQLQSLLQMLIVGLGAAMTILVTQYWGKRDAKSVKSIIGIALKFSIAAGLALTLATLLYPVQVLRLFTNDPAVVATGLEYLSIVRFSYIFFCVTQVMIAAMRSVERVRIGMYLSIVTFFVNVSLNWVLIFGHLGFPALGVKGAAIATLIARILETPIILYYVRVIDDQLRIKFSELIRTNWVLVKDFFRYGFPVIMGDIFWGINIAVQGAIIGRLGATALASVSIANIVFNIVGVAMRGVSGATAVIIGQTVGAGDYDRVKDYAKRLQVLFLIFGVISGTVLYFVKDYVILLYNVGPETITLTRQFLTVLSVTIVGTAYQASALTGIVRAGGSIYFVLINDLIWVWVVVIPSALLAAFVFNASPVVVFACLKCDQVLKCAVAVVKVNRFKWIKNLTRDTDALEQASA